MDDLLRNPRKHNNDIFMYNRGNDGPQKGHQSFEYHAA